MAAQWCSCCHCAQFVPDPIGDGTGIGECQPYEAYKAQGVSAKALDAAFRRLGNKVFYGGNNGEDDRYCSKFVAKVDA